MTTLVLKFKKIESYDETKYNTFYSSSNVETIINESDIDDIFEKFYRQIGFTKENNYYSIKYQKKQKNRKL